MIETNKQTKAVILPLKGKKVKLFHLVRFHFFFTKVLLQTFIPPMILMLHTPDFHPRPLPHPQLQDQELLQAGMVDKHIHQVYAKSVSRKSWKPLL